MSEYFFLIKRHFCFGFILSLLFACQNKTFRLKDSDNKGIDFVNAIFENDTSNLAVYPQLYYGAGVGIGDFNNDGLEDIFFGGSQVSGRLYINQGNWRFKDITEKAGLLSDRWQTGINVVDINGDGNQDLYINVSGKRKTANLLYINNGNLTFTEQAETYGLADTRQVIQSVFFDFDNDSDLDVFMIVNPDEYLHVNVNQIQPRKIDGTANSTDVLYRNNGDGTFTDISEEAGILIEGYSLGVAVSDINTDGWPDIYVSNDFLTNDILYINQKNGTYKDEIKSYISQSSFAGMGLDIADFNNDKHVDIIQLEMRPEDNYRQKMILPPAAVNKYFMLEEKGYLPQNGRNSLQLGNDGQTFNEIGFLSGLSSTDWSWSALFCDMDNDMDKDLYITNGFGRNLANRDFIDYTLNEMPMVSDQRINLATYSKKVMELDPVAIPNYLYENKGSVTFKNITAQAGLDIPSVSHGAAYADLDADGDLDLVINNLNSKASIIENIKGNQGNYLKLDLKGPRTNNKGIGAKVYILSGGVWQLVEQWPIRGFMSSVSQQIHIGLGKEDTIDTLKVTWPNGRISLKTNLKSNQHFTIDFQTAKRVQLKGETRTNRESLFSRNTDSILPTIVHKENNYIDFNDQWLKPHMHSRLGPPLAVGDINKDGLEDFFIGGASGYKGTLQLQKKEGGFEERMFAVDAGCEDVNADFFDADGDGDLDLIVICGGVADQEESLAYGIRFYRNDGEGNFEKTNNTIPLNVQSNKAVAIADMDADGDLDIFIGGRVIPNQYPLAPKSVLLRNDMENGTLRFTDVTKTIAPDLINIGMVSDAIWRDYDNDNYIDLILVGEFMPLTIFKNNNGRLSNVTEDLGLSETEGWWNTIKSGDFDHDGYVDFVVGNQGLNTPYKIAKERPYTIYAKDFDGNGKIDPMATYFINGVEEFAHTRDALNNQMNSFKNSFTTNQAFAEKSFKEIFQLDKIKGINRVKAIVHESVIMLNDKGNRFRISPLPIAAQFAPIHAIHVSDFNSDGLLDVLVGGNSNSTNVVEGWSRSFIGLSYLKGDGKGNFTCLPVDDNISRLGFVRNIVPLTYLGERKILVAQNSGRLAFFDINTKD